MSEYQPKDKSFERYIQIGYEFASGKELSQAEMALLEKISDIDTSIIKIDDILDHEERRNDHACIYLIDGIDKTIINARLDEINGVQALTDLIAFRKCFPLFSYEILKVFNNNYMRGIYEGQKIDKELEEAKEIRPDMIDRYFLMTRKFTGGHIRFGLEIGQLLAGKVPDKDVSAIAEAMGINRQIVDDFEDYFKAHHYPQGDIKRGAKRLPEILFTLHGGDRETVLKLISEKDFAGVIAVVLNPDVRKELYRYCEANETYCMGIDTTFEYSNISTDIGQILDRMPESDPLPSTI
ncbi:MAG: polyprenyl synthetase family protein [Candidatus Moranbacteria bacterium]|nr:polyprenyl synthetase family protein [Candidatus Moranbacteria bacterium]